MNLSDMTQEELASLQKELSNELDARRKNEKLLLLSKRKHENSIVTDHACHLLHLSKHTYSTCDDDAPINDHRGCPRCNLLASITQGSVSIEMEFSLTCEVNPIDL